VPGIAARPNLHSLVAARSSIPALPRSFVAAARRASAAPGPWTVALAAAVALAVAMGIGRFAFTPLLPMMLAEGALDIHAASWLASANYLGYLAGALLCTVAPWLTARLPWWPGEDGPRLVRAGLVATALLTLGMAVPWPAAWPTLRFAAGVASAYVLVYASGWCLTELAARDASALGGAMFTGPGIGILVSGLLVSALVATGAHAAVGWAVFGALAFALSAAIWPVLGSRHRPASAHRLAAEPARHALEVEARHGPVEVGWLAFAYGLAGFGYIITATFLPVIARTALPGSPWLDLFWPILGAGVVVGALLSTRLRLDGDLRLLLAGAYLLQAFAIGLPVWWPTPAGFVVGSVILGLPFTAITFFAMQEVRRIRPVRTASTIGLVTAIYGIGQIVGPPLAARLVGASRSAAAGFALALEIAAGTLVVGALVFGAMSRAYPQRERRARV
jgi:MFS family permease